MSMPMRTRGADPSTPAWRLPRETILHVRQQGQFRRPQNLRKARHDPVEPGIHLRATALEHRTREAHLEADLGIRVGSGILRVIEAKTKRQGATLTARQFPGRQTAEGLQHLAGVTDRAERSQVHDQRHIAADPAAGLIEIRVDAGEVRTIGPMEEEVRAASRFSFPSPLELMARRFLEPREVPPRRLDPLPEGVDERLEREKRCAHGLAPLVTARRTPHPVHAAIDTFLSGRITFMGPVSVLTDGE